MATEPKRVRLQVDADPRFAVGVGGAVRCLAEAYGMSEERSREFQQAAVDACLSAFQANGSAQYTVELRCSEERIETVVNCGSGA